MNNRLLLNRELKPMLAMLLMVAAIIFVFQFGLGGGFIFDDRQNVVRNGALLLLSQDLDSWISAAYSFQPGNGSRALVMLSFAFDYWRGGMDPVVFKVTNICIHVVTSLVLIGFIRSLAMVAGYSDRAANAVSIVVTALWALHPLQVSSVLYVVQRMQTMSTLFTLLALWSYVEMRRAMIAGKSIKRGLILVIFFEALGLASKEDAVLLPAFAMALEFSIFNFCSQGEKARRILRLGCVLLTLAIVAVYFFLVVPRYWHWESYPGRDFSSYERLLTQARVLFLYLRQIFIPSPSDLPFYYDNYVVSRGLLSPLSTLACIAFLLGMLVWAWKVRLRFQLFAFGIFLFFLGHSLTSNILNLELVFEHRNQLPSIGVFLAVVVGVSEIWRRLGWELTRLLLLGCVLVVFEAAATANRAYVWGDPLRFAERSVDYSPNSERAWLALCTYYFDLNNGEPESQYIDKAIDVCEEGARRTSGVSLLFNVVIYRTIKGDVEAEDWRRFVAAFAAAPYDSEMIGLGRAILRNVQTGFPLDPKWTSEALKIVARRDDLDSRQYLQIALYVYKNAEDPSEALPYLKKFVLLAPDGDPLVERVFEDLQKSGYANWVVGLKVARINGGKVM